MSTWKAAELRRGEMKPKAGLVQCRNRLVPNGETGRGVKAQEEVPSLPALDACTRGKVLVLEC